QVAARRPFPQRQLAATRRLSRLDRLYACVFFFRCRSLLFCLVSLSFLFAFLFVLVFAVVLGFFFERSQHTRAALNHYRWPVYGLCGADQRGEAMPLAFMLTSSENHEPIVTFL